MKKDYFNSRDDKRLNFRVKNSITLGDYLDGIYITPWRGEILIPSNEHRMIRVFDSSGKYLFQFGPHGTDDHNAFKSPMGISAFQEKLFVCDSSSKLIHVFDQDYHSISSINLSPDRPQFICHQSQGNIVVIVSAISILLLDPDGNLIKRIYNKPNRIYNKAYGLFDLQGVCCNSKDQIFAIDCVSDCVIVFDRQGNGLYNFDVTNANIICIDWQDNILVADSRIENGGYIFTSTGQLVDRLPIVKPLALHIQGRRMVVTDHNSSIYVFTN